MMLSAISAQHLLAYLAIAVCGIWHGRRNNQMTQVYEKPWTWSG